MTYREPTLPESALIRFSELPLATPAMIAANPLLSRTETKFAVPIYTLPRLLEGLTQHYHRMGHPTGNRYETRYFDSLDLENFHDQRRGRTPRRKFRVRSRDDDPTVWLEIKTKDNHGTTSKIRRQATKEPEADTARELAGFAQLSGMGDPGLLRPTVDVRFRRMALVSDNVRERITIDYGLQMAPAATEYRDQRFERQPSATMTMSGIADTLPLWSFVEVKQPILNLRSPVILAMRELNIRATSFSKYGVAMVLCNPALPQNGFLPILKHLCNHGCESKI